MWTVSPVRAVALLRSQVAFRARLPLRHCCSARHARHDSQGAGIWLPETDAASATPASGLRRHRHTRCSAAAASATEQNAEAAAPAASTVNGRSQQQQQHLLLYNTMSRSKEPFQPRQDQGNKVSMYVCGVTVYSMSHIGHARAYVAFDVLFRYLAALGYEVQYVRNFTDVDDKIITRAAELGEETSVLSQRYVDEFAKDMQQLHCLPPSLEPRATQHIPAMVSTIQQIIHNGHAYAVDGDVFFDIQTLPGYGRLSRHTLDAESAGQRVGVDGRKRSPGDFALWKAAKPGEPEWDSPWGRGRPGWHIECSAMIRELMGPVIDIHGGGRDLQFPHHENELAQSQAAGCSCDGDAASGGGDFVRFWVHNGFVNVDAEKMSKSLGNFFTIRQATEAYAPAALRWWLLGTHYRAPINYTQRALEEASERLYSFYQAVVEARQVLGEAGDEGETAAARAAEEAAAGRCEVLAAVHAGMRDDLNTPQAVAALSQPVTRVNELLYTRKGRKQADRLQVLSALGHAITATFRLLGMPVDDPAAVLQELRAKALQRAGMSEEDVSAAIDERAAARKGKNFEEADAVRERLAGKGILIMDSPTGTTWRPGVQDTDL